MTRSEIKSLPLRARTGLVQRLTQAIAEALLRRHERALLARLDDHLLRDIGLSPDEAKTECAKPFWRP